MNGWPICVKWVFKGGNDVSEIFLARAGPCPALYYPHARRKVHLWCIFFALLGMNGLLPAELKLRENTEYTTNCIFFIGERKGRQMRRKGNKNKQDG